jgi:prevent-host-death family protein
MQEYSIGELKAKFSHALDMVQSGEEILVLSGRAKKPVAKLVPIDKPAGKRLLGALESKAEFVFKEDWEMSTEELLGS